MLWRFLDRLLGLEWLIGRDRPREKSRCPPGPIAVSTEAAERLRTLKARRPMTETEHNCIAALAWQLGVPKDWQFDDEAMCFRPPQED